MVFSIFSTGILEVGILFDLSGSFTGVWEDNNPALYDDTIGDMSGSLTATVADAAQVNAMYGTASSVGDTWDLVITGGQFSQDNN